MSSRFQRTCPHNPFIPRENPTVWGTNSPTYIVPGLPNNVRRLFCFHPDRNAPHQNISLSLWSPVFHWLGQRGADVLPACCLRASSSAFRRISLSLIPGLAVPQPDLTIHHHKVHIGGVSVSIRVSIRLILGMGRGFIRSIAIISALFPVSREPISSSSPHTLQRQWWSSPAPSPPADNNHHSWRGGRSSAPFHGVEHIKTGCEHGTVRCQATVTPNSSSSITGVLFTNWRIPGATLIWVSVF